MCPQDTRKNFKPAKSSSHSTPSTQLFLAQVLSPLLETHRTDKPLHNPPQGEARPKALLSPGAISYHIDELRLTRLHTAALQTSTEFIARYNITICLALKTKFDVYWLHFGTVKQHFYAYEKILRIGQNGPHEKIIRFFMHYNV